jgi:hypothetical protein
VANQGRPAAPGFRPFLSTRTQSQAGRAGALLRGVWGPSGSKPVQVAPKNAYFDGLGLPLRSVSSTRRPPYTVPYVRWCGRGGIARLPPIPIDAVLARRLSTERSDTQLNHQPAELNCLSDQLFTFYNLTVSRRALTACSRQGRPLLAVPRTDSVRAEFPHTAPTLGA